MRIFISNNDNMYIMVHKYLYKYTYSQDRNMLSTYNNKLVGDVLRKWWSDVILMGKWAGNIQYLFTYKYRVASYLLKNTN